MSNIIGVTQQDLINRYDARLIGQSVNDSDSQLTVAEILVDPVTQANIDDAAGMVVSALYVAYKYTAAEIATVTDETLSMLKRIVCDLAMVYICQRRGYDIEDKLPMAALSLDQVQRLRNGERVLNLAANEQAGLSRATRPSICQQERMGLVVAEWRFFPNNWRGCGCGPTGLSGQGRW